MDYQAACNKILALEEELRLLDSKLQLTSVHLNKKKEEWEQFKDNLYKEKLDVEQLERLSLSSIFSKIVGNYEKKHEKEYQEYISAKRTYDEYAAYVDDLNKELSRYQYEITKLKDEIKVQKVNLRTNYPEGRILAEEENEKKKELYRLRKEIEEAEAAAITVYSLALEAQKEYESAKGWATYDTFFGGGLLTDMVKYSKIDSAAETSNQMKAASERMLKELSDVNLAFQGNIDSINDGTRFFDIAFDNIFTDWNVRTRLTENIEQLEDYIIKLEDILSNLRQRKNSINQKIDELM